MIIEVRCFFTPPKPNWVDDLGTEIKQRLSMRSHLRFLVYVF
jgi:hypothetical protein